MELPVLSQYEFSIYPGQGVCCLLLSLHLNDVFWCTWELLLVKFNLILFCPSQQCSGLLPDVGVWAIMSLASEVDFYCCSKYLSWRESLIKSVVRYLFFQLSERSGLCVCPINNKVWRILWSGESCLSSLLQPFSCIGYSPGLAWNINGVGIHLWQLTFLLMSKVLAPKVFLLNT